MLAKTKLTSIEVLISKTLIDSNITNDEFVSLNNVLKEYDDMKKDIKIKKLKHQSKIFAYFSFILLLEV